MRPRAGACLAVAAVALAGACSGDGGRGIDAEELPNLVLQPGDVPELQRFEEGRQTRPDLPTGDRADPERFGRSGGWIARFRLAGGTAESEGPLVVESRADLFGDAEGAEQELEAARREIAGVWESVEAAAVGEATWAATTVQEAATADVRYYAIAWREANVVATLLVQGFDDGLTVADAVALARAQQRRIEAAQES